VTIVVLVRFCAALEVCLMLVVPVKNDRAPASHFRIDPPVSFNPRASDQRIGGSPELPACPQPKCS
jgi:hypothetical protein